MKNVSNRLEALNCSWVVSGQMVILPSTNPVFVFVHYPSVNLTQAIPPGSSLSSRTRVKTLAYDTILANARFFDDDISAVPKMALTVGVATVLESKEVLVVVTGLKKSLALSKAIGLLLLFFWLVGVLDADFHSRGRCKSSRKPFAFSLAISFSESRIFPSPVDTFCAPATSMGAHRCR